MRVALTRVALFFHVLQIAIGRELSIAADDAAAGQRGEAEKPDKTTHGVPLSCARAIRVPAARDCKRVTTSRFASRPSVSFQVSVVVDHRSLNLLIRLTNCCDYLRGKFGAPNQLVGWRCIPDCTKTLEIEFALSAGELAGAHQSPDENRVRQKRHENPARMSRGWDEGCRKIHGCSESERAAEERIEAAARKFLPVRHHDVFPPPAGRSRVVGVFVKYLKVTTDALNPCVDEETGLERHGQDREWHEGGGTVVVQEGKWHEQGGPGNQSGEHQAHPQRPTFAYRGPQFSIFGHSQVVYHRSDAVRLTLSPRVVGCSRIFLFRGLLALC